MEQALKLTPCIKALLNKLLSKGKPPQKLARRTQIYRVFSRVVDHFFDQAAIRSSSGLLLSRSTRVPSTNFTPRARGEAAPIR